MRCLGPLEAEWEGAERPLAWPSRRGKTLFKYLVLQRDPRLGEVGGERRADPFGLVAQHEHEVLGAGGLRGAQGVPDEGTSTEGVQDLRGGRLHPGALTRGEDDHGDRAGAHARGLLSGRGRGGRSLSADHGALAAASWLPREDSNLDELGQSEPS